MAVQETVERERCIIGIKQRQRRKLFELVISTKVSSYLSGLTVRCETYLKLVGCIFYKCCIVLIIFCCAWFLEVNTHFILKLIENLITNKIKY